MSFVLDHVNYIYDADGPEPQYALRNISLVIPKGQYIGVIGHTGSGKSTLMQLLNGLLVPTNGTVLFDGEDISDADFDKKRLRRKVGLVFQYPEHQLFDHTVFQDVCFGPRNLGYSKKETELLAYQALRSVHFPEELYYQPPFMLSGGQKRQAAIAGVLAVNPDFFIMDEPTAGLDPSGRKELLEMTARLHREEGKTILLVSHNMEDVAQYAERILVINAGQLVLDGTPGEVFSQVEELKKIGLDVPQATRLMNELRRRGIPVRTDAVTYSEAKQEILRVLHPFSGRTGREGRL